MKRVRKRYRASLLPFAVGFVSLVATLTTALSDTSSQQGFEAIQKLIQQGELAAARDMIDEALKQFPNEASLYNLLGVIDAQQDKHEASEANFKRAIAYVPNSVSVYLNLARLYQRMASKDSEALGKALAAYRSLLELDSGNLEAIYQSAILEFRQGSFKESLIHLFELPDEDRNRPELLAVLCADQAALGMHSEAEATSDRVLISAALTEADVLLVLPSLETIGNGDLAVKLLEGLVKRRSISPNTLQRLGLVYARRGQLDRARETLEHAAADQPDSIELLLALSRVANQQRDYRGTLGYLAHARDLDPQNAGIHFFFGLVCVEQDLAHEAFESLKRAVALDPDNPYYNYALGAVSVQRDNVRESVPYFQKYCKLMPRDPHGRFALGVAYYYGHELVTAQKELEAAAQYAETRAGSYYFLGRIANQEGRIEEAQIQLERCLEDNPRYADAYAELGILNIKQKQYAKAEVALLRATALDAANYRANINLVLLYQRTHDPRAKGQVERFERIRSERIERTKDFLRIIEVRP